MAIATAMRIAQAIRMAAGNCACKVVPGEASRTRAGERFAGERAKLYKRQLCALPRLRRKPKGWQAKHVPRVNSLHVVASTKPGSVESTGAAWLHSAGKPSPTPPHGKRTAIKHNAYYVYCTRERQTAMNIINIMFSCVRPACTVKLVSMAAQVSTVGGGGGIIHE